jgi:serine protease AprX
MRLPGLEKVWAQGYTGQGQCIAIIDSGFYAHPDFADRVVGYLDLAGKRDKMADPWGHGTHVAGIAAGSGRQSQGRHKGVAYEANLVGVRVASVTQAIQGLNWVIEKRLEYAITVVNISMGDVACLGYEACPWCLAVEGAVSAGLVVVVAAGNDKDTISTPGISPGAITVGGLDDQGTPDPTDDTAWSALQVAGKPDLMAPAVDIMSTLSPHSGLDATWRQHRGMDYMEMNGTSMATPAVAGLVALLRQARPDLTPAQLKQLLIDSALPQAGMRIVRADLALELARTHSGPNA